MSTFTSPLEPDNSDWAVPGPSNVDEIVAGLNRVLDRLNVIGEAPIPGVSTTPTQPAAPESKSIIGLLQEIADRLPPKPARQVTLDDARKAFARATAGNGSPRPTIKVPRLPGESGLAWAARSFRVNMDAQSRVPYGPTGGNVLNTRPGTTASTEARDGWNGLRPPTIEQVRASLGKFDNGIPLSADEQSILDHPSVVIDPPKLRGGLKTIKILPLRAD